MNKLPRKYKLYIPFMLIGIVLLAFLPTSCTCNCSSDDTGQFSSWNSPANKIVYLSDDRDGIFLIKADGMELSTVFADDTLSISPFTIYRSPDGSRIAFYYNQFDIATGIHVAPIAVANVNGSGYVDVEYYTYKGQPTSWSPDSKKLAVVSYRDGNGEIYVMNADGTGATNITNSPASDHDPAWSPDGSKIAFTSYRGGVYGIYVMNPDGSGQTKLMDDIELGTRLLWSPDGGRIAFLGDVDGELGGDIGLYVMNADGTGLTEIIESLPHALHVSLSWSVDGSKLLFSDQMEIDGSDQNEIFLINADGTGLINLTSNPSMDIWPTWSPDGSSIAFSSDRDGNYDIFVMNADGSDQTNITNSPDDERIIVWD